MALKHFSNAMKSSLKSIMDIKVHKENLFNLKWSSLQKEKKIDNILLMSYE